MPGRHALGRRRVGGRRLGRWVRRYGPAEVAATLGALLGAVVGVRLGGPIGAALGADLGEGLAFYAVVVAREVWAERSAARPRTVRRMLTDLFAEFGPAEALDSFALRPLAMYAGPYVTGDLLTGTLLGKIVADVVFYVLAALAHERRHAGTVADRAQHLDRATPGNPVSPHPSYGRER